MYVCMHVCMYICVCVYIVNDYVGTCMPVYALQPILLASASYAVVSRSRSRSRDIYVCSYAHVRTYKDKYICIYVNTWLHSSHQW